MSKVLTNENYYEDDEYFSVSAFKKFDKCELAGSSGVYTGSGTSDALLFGSYVDAYIEGTLDEFLKEHPEMFSTRGKSAGSLKSAFSNAPEICEFITTDPTFSKFMSGDKQTIMTGEIEGVPFKIKMDVYFPGKLIADLKVMRTVTNKAGDLIDFITPYRYDLQMACYQEIVYQNTGIRIPTYICAVTKESPIDSVIVYLPQDILDRAMDEVRLSIQRYYDVKMKRVEPIGCGHCQTCVATREKTEIVNFEEIINKF